MGRRISVPAAFTAVLLSAALASRVLASGAITPGTVAPNFTKNALGGGAVSLSDHAGKVVVLFLFGHNCPICLGDGPSVEANLHDYFTAMYPGQVQVLGVDVWNGTPAQVQSFKNTTGATYPLLQLGASATGGNVDELYGPWDNYIVINKQGIVRYHAALAWPHGNRYHLDEIRGTVDSLVTNTAGAGEGAPRGPALTASPSPFRASTSVALTIPDGARGRAQIAVHDLAGRRVATLFDGLVAPGITRVTWDGRGESGDRLAPGLYLVAARIGEQRLHTRIALVR